MKIKLLKALLFLWTKIKNNKTLSLIFLLGLIVRFWGIYPGYHQYHQDEPQIYSRAILTILGKQKELGYFGYPALIPLIHSFVYTVFFLPINFVAQFIIHFQTIALGNLTFSDFFNKYIIGLREINVMYWGRYLNALFGSMSILLTYWVAKSYFNRMVGLMGASLLALNYRHVLSSHFSLVDVPNGFFFLLVFLPALGILNNKNMRNYILAGVTTGLSMSTKLSPFALIIPILAHLIRVISKKIIFNWQLIKGPLIVCSMALVTVVIVNLFHIINYKDVMRDSEALMPRYQTGIIEFRPYAYVYLIKYGLTPIPSLLFLIGVLYGLKKYFRKTILVLSLILVFFFSLTIYSRGGLYVRNFVGVYPFLLIFSALGIEGIRKLFPQNNILKRIILLSLLIGAIFQPLLNVLVLDKSYSEEWNFTKAKKYLKVGFENKILAAQPIIASIVLPEEVNRIDFSINSSFSLAELQEEKVDYLLMDSDSVASALMWWMYQNNRNYFGFNLNKPAYQTFEAGALKEIFMHEVIRFTKPWQAPEANLFLIKIPPKPDLSVKETVFEESFDKNANWRIKGGQGYQISQLNQQNGTQCLKGGCLHIGSVYTEYKNMLHFTRLTSQAIKVKEGSYYQVEIKIKSSQDIPKNQRDGFLKVELYTDQKSAEIEDPGDYIFLSPRFYGKGEEWEKQSVVFTIPKGIQYLTFSVQKGRFNTPDLFFDDLILKRVDFKSNINNFKQDQIPEELLFINSIL